MVFPMGIALAVGVGAFQFLSGRRDAKRQRRRDQFLAQEEQKEVKRKKGLLTAERALALQVGVQRRSKRPSGL